MLKHIINRVGLSTALRNIIYPTSLGITRGGIVKILRSTAPESFFSRLIVRVVGRKLSFNFVSSFLGISIFLLRNAGLVAGYLIITEMFTLLTNPNTFNMKFLEFLNSEERNPSLNPLILQTLMN
jgi:hypothetical protein